MQDCFISSLEEGCGIVAFQEERGRVRHVDCYTEFLESCIMLRVLMMQTCKHCNFNVSSQKTELSVIVDANTYHTLSIQAMHPYNN